MRNEQTKNTSEQQADIILAVGLPESGYEKHTYSNIYRPAYDLAPPVYRYFFNHFSCKAITVIKLFPDSFD